MTFLQVMMKKIWVCFFMLHSIYLFVFLSLYMSVRACYGRMWTESLLFMQNNKVDNLMSLYLFVSLYLSVHVAVCLDMHLCACICVTNILTISH